MDKCAAGAFGRIFALAPMFAEMFIGGLDRCIVSLSYDFQSAIKRRGL